ncbi:hypothetical protein HN784_01800 [bacterium]|jgi:hypothetical protein|nr:hypothetical protein [bacterium]MBT4251253.1 hypothetical protein [bacterium]MBT4598366.1 hypothetical protein [bacterium]MBT6754199.1 hypothetical protein [bacterium]MBT7038030.1 hypothetical protein [bacterium]
MQKKIFLISALCFFAANNLHFVVSSAFFPKLLDIIAVATLGFGIFVMLVDKSDSRK